MKLGAFVAGFGTGLASSRDHTRRKEESKLRERQMKLSEDSGAREQTRLDEMFKTSSAARAREAVIREGYGMVGRLAMGGGSAAPMPAGIAPAAGAAPAGVAHVADVEDAAVPAGVPQPGPAETAKPEDQLGKAIFNNPNMVRDPAFLRSAIKIFADRQMPEAVQWIEKLAKAQEEGGITALQHLISGNMKGAADSFNAVGRQRVVGEIQPGPNGTFLVPFESGLETVNARETLRQLRPQDAQRVAYAEYLQGRNQTAENVAVTRANAARDVGTIRADAARDVGTIRATSAQIIARERESGKTARGGAAGGTSGNVARILDNADGTRTIVTRSGQPSLLVDDGGKPIMGSEGGKIAAQILRELMKDPTNRDPNKPEAARGLASRVTGQKEVPQPMPANQSDAKVGVLYQTGRGPARWNGKGFMPEPVR